MSHGSWHEVIDTKGNAFNGLLSEKSDDDLVNIIGSHTDTITHDEVVSTQETGETFIRRLQRNIDLGLTLLNRMCKKLMLQGSLIPSDR